ncbi:MAG: hypothetical protein ABJA93_06135 [Sporichthyaceae bacterium]
MDLPDVLEDGRSHALKLRISPSLSRIAWPILFVAVAVWVASSHLYGDPSTAPSPHPSASLDVREAEHAAVGAGLSVAAEREARIVDVPAAYRDAAARASAMHGGRTPGDFFLALAFHRTWYGELLSGSEGVRYAPFGPVQWDPTEFGRYADPSHRDINDVLDSFLAIDNALHNGHRPDFSNGAFGPSRQLGMERTEAQSVAAIYDVLEAPSSS